MKRMSDDVVYTISEVSRLLKVNKNFVYGLIKSGELKAVKIGSLKIRKNDLHEYLDNLNPTNY